MPCSKNLESILRKKKSNFDPADTSDVTNIFLILVSVG